MNLQDKVIKAKAHLGNGKKLIEGATSYVTDKGVIYPNELPKGKKQAYILTVKKGTIIIYDEKDKQIEPIKGESKPNKSSSKLRNSANEKSGKDS